MNTWRAAVRSLAITSVFLITAGAYAARPTVSSITPNTGGTGGGTPVLITGSNFATNAVVKIGGLVATGVTVVDSGNITATTPAHVPGVVSVQVQNPGKGAKNAQLKNGFTYVCLAPPCVAIPEAISVDPTPSAFSDGNNVMEAGEADVIIAPTWRNTTGAPSSMTGTLSNLTGATGMIVDASANYGFVAMNEVADSQADSYRVSIDSASRPGTHWDATVTETVSTSPATATAPNVWTIHIGDSFSDVARGGAFYGFVEALLHSGVTNGCAQGTYCPGAAATRAQMAAFISRALTGGDANLPQEGDNYNCTAGGVSEFSDVLPTDPFCRHIHYVKQENITNGCNALTGEFCQNPATTRGQMGAFIARDLVAPAGDAGVPTSVAIDPITGLNEFGKARSYDCSDDATLYFSDVKGSTQFCSQIYYIWSRGIIDGYGDGSYGPNGAVSRDQMAKFLVNAFSLKTH